MFAVSAIFEINSWVYLIWSGIAMGIASVSIYLQWGLVGEAIEYNEEITGKRTEGSIYGTFNLSRRIGQTIGTSLPLYFLAFFGYDANLSMQTDTTKFVIIILCTLIPGIVVLGSWAAFKYVWNIGDKRTITEPKRNEIEGE